MQSKFQEAIEWYDKALKIDPNYIDVLSDKGRFFTNWVNTKRR